VGSVDASLAAELMSARHFGSKPGYLNTVTYLAPSLDIPPEEYQTAYYTRLRASKPAMPQS